MIPGFDSARIAASGRPVTIGAVPAGLDPFLLAEFARTSGPVAYVLSDGQRIADVEQMLGFAAPEIPVLTLPGWDCLPYDRVSPSADTSARRLAVCSTDSWRIAGSMGIFQPWTSRVTARWWCWIPNTSP